MYESTLLKRRLSAIKSQRVRPIVFCLRCGLLTRAKVSGGCHLIVKLKTVKLVCSSVDGMYNECILAEQVWIDTRLRNRKLYLVTKYFASTRLYVGAADNVRCHHGSYVPLSQLIHSTGVTKVQFPFSRQVQRWHVLL